MKQRYSSLDVKVIAHELSARLTSLRISNVYDLSSRIFLIKFSKPDHKEQFVIDSGFRAHLTSFVRTTAATPSPFVARLRKTLKTRRVTEVKQVGTDRILQFTFSDGQYFLFLEFYAGGNIVLTDNELNVLALLRMVNEGEEHETLRVGLKYNLSMRQNYKGVPELTGERIRAGLQKAADKAVPDVSGKKGKKAGKDALKKGLASSINEIPPMLIDHAMKVKGFDSAVLPVDVLKSEELLGQLLEVLKEAKKVVEEITSTDVVKGYILAKPSAKNADPANAGVDAHAEGGEKNLSGLIYDDFHPFKPRQFEDDPNITFLEFEGFNKTVDEFFSSIEGQKLESKLHEREEAARRKLEAARQEHKKRLGGLQEVQELNIRKAEAILANVARVEEAQAAMNGLIGQGMDWVDIGRLIENEQSRDNEVAKLIKLPLKLHENTITLLLGEAEEQEDDDSADESVSESESESSDSEEEESTVKKQARKPAADTRLTIDIDLSLTPWANASQYYDQKKTAAVKEEKTLQASTKALKSAEQKITLDLRKGLKVEKDILRPVRKSIWFEKFHYFISSDGYLVLGGKDAQQNEMLYRRYLKKGDIYVHADLNGASSVIIKNNPSTPDAPIPPSTLSQAGTLSVASSNAWDTKALMSAYWVNADQVSKTAPTGEYLADGGFMIRGKKNFLPPAPLLLGFALMFNISEESKARHQKHRFQNPAKLASEAAVVAFAKETASSHDNEQDRDSDDEFPDAQLDAGAVDSDGEDLPDAKLDTGDEDSEADTAVGTQHDSDSESDEDESNPSQNPLQSSVNPEKGEYVAGEGGRPKSPLSQADTLDEDSIAGDETENKPGYRHLPAKHRQLLKKGISPATIAAMSEQGDLDSQYSQDDDTTTVGGSKDKSQPLPRGKRGKQKKAMAKYANQDEDERALAMHILGSKSGQDAAAAEAEAKRAKEEQAAKDKERRRLQHLKTQEAGKAAEAARRAALEAEDEEENDDLTRESLLNLDAFIGRPLPGDELLSAIPICAPWASLGTYKYKAKLQPGAVKKGKAVNEILSKWQLATKHPKALDKTSTDVEKIWPAEIGFIEGLKAVESVGVIPVTKVRVLMAGGADGKSGGGGQAGKGKGNGKTAKRGGRGSKKK
ncbi:hypothetical protein EG328_007893 [Venturia inaequalis]|uniref:Ribosome quality control complex subunit 2 n=1 Tax=Venturia inaequalis TaxID=5025 RepID=A0A8H3YQ60_VENIN|nr:hypothetical protein EG328_007893 [Venturia inaequalis]KAE9972731.1 hypothetical protein EG327_009385 [Venturia inaequalis]RDI77351.1 hypothetical protein Vi05172_g12650 [Venturia inaequalis]